MDTGQSSKESRTRRVKMEERSNFYAEVEAIAADSSVMMVLLMIQVGLEE